MDILDPEPAIHTRSASPRRYELKLVCPGCEFARIRSWVRMHPMAFRTTYPPRRVNSLYLDTHQLSSLAANLDGLSIRSKLRCRWYGDELNGVRAQLEWKHKRDMLGSKEVTPLDQPLDLTQPWHAILANIRTSLYRTSPEDNHTSPTWLTRLQTIDQPALLNRYQRAYYATPDGAVRVTIDHDQIAYDQRLITSHLNLTTPLPIEDVVVVEVKGDAIQAELVEEVINHFPLPRTRNSKYAGGMLAALYSQ